MGQFQRCAVAAACLLIGLGGSSRATDAPNVTVEPGAGFGTFVVVNQGPAVSLRPDVMVQQMTGGTWRTMPVTNLFLRQECHAGPPPPCVDLPAGTTLRPTPWTGDYCASQCPSACRLDGHAPAGIYRFVLHSCVDATAFTSPPFEKTH
jgi:hypothetical protein